VDHDLRSTGCGFRKIDETREDEENREDRVQGFDRLQLKATDPPEEKIGGFKHPGETQNPQNLQRTQEIESFKGDDGGKNRNQIDETVEAEDVSEFAFRGCNAKKVLARKDDDHSGFGHFHPHGPALSGGKQRLDDDQDAGKYIHQRQQQIHDPTGGRFIRIKIIENFFFGHSYQYRTKSEIFKGCISLTILSTIKVHAFLFFFS